MEVNARLKNMEKNEKLLGNTKKWSKRNRYIAIGIKMR